MKQHMKTQTGERPYKCKACDYSSSDVESLMSYMRIHTEEKSLKCSECDKPFQERIPSK